MRNGQGDLLTPSAVIFVDRDDIVVGKQAVKSCADAPDRYAECFKRDMGLAHFRHKVRGLDVPPEVLSALVLERLKKDAEQRLNAQVRSAVVTVPAFFDARPAARPRRTPGAWPAWRCSTSSTSRRRRPWPTATRPVFSTWPADRRRGASACLVYDLGGGTFDVTVLEIDGARFHALATDGDVCLGGKDFDERMVNYLAEQVPRPPRRRPAQRPPGRRPTLAGRPGGQARPFGADQDHGDLFPRRDPHADRDHPRAVRRGYARSRGAHGNHGLAGRAAGRAGLAADRPRAAGRRIVADAHGRQMLRALTGKEPDCSQSPDEAVAHGAALYAGMITSIGGSKPACELVNVNSHSLGVVGIHPKTGQRAVSVLIPKNTPLPCKVVKAFRAAKADMRGVSVPVVEGESERPEECILLGQCAVARLAARIAPRGPHRGRIPVCGQRADLRLCAGPVRTVLGTRGD